MFNDSPAVIDEVFRSTSYLRSLLCNYIQNVQNFLWLLSKWAVSDFCILLIAILLNKCETAFWGHATLFRPLPCLLLCPHDAIEAPLKGHKFISFKSHSSHSSEALWAVGLHVFFDLESYQKTFFFLLNKVVKPVYCHGDMLRGERQWLWIELCKETDKMASLHFFDYWRAKDDLSASYFQLPSINHPSASATKPQPHIWAVTQRRPVATGRHCSIIV